MFRNQRQWLLYEADKQSGGGGDDKSGESGNGAVAFQQALDAHKGDVQKFATRLFEDNYQLRTNNRELRGKTAPEGSVILQGDELALWNAYKGLGKPTELVLASALDPFKTDLGKAQGELTTAKAELAQYKRNALLRDVADAAGVVYGVLATLDKPELSYEIADDKDKDGKAIKVVKVKEGDQVVDLDAYAAQKWSVFLPALRPAQEAGTPFIVQAGTASSAAKLTVAQAAQGALNDRYGKKATK